MEMAFEAAVVYASATQNTFVILAKCLTDNGALKPGQFSSAIKSMLTETDADRRRLDYQYVQNLARMLDEAEPRDKK